MKKPKSYYGFAWDKCGSGYSKKYIKTPEGQEKIKKCKKRNKKLRKKWEKTGVCITETWNLDKTIAEFTIPRLKILKKHSISYPGNLKDSKEWKKVLKKMIWSFQYVLDDYGFEYIDNKEKSKRTYEKFKKGMKLFADYYSNLWD